MHVGRGEGGGAGQRGILMFKCVKILIITIESSTVDHMCKTTLHLGHPTKQRSEDDIAGSESTTCSSHTGFLKVTCLLSPSIFDCSSD